MPRKQGYKKNGRKPRALTKAQYNAVKKIDRQQEFVNAPMLRLEKSYSQNVAPVDITSTHAIFQCPYQDLPLQITSGAGTLDANQRLGSEIYPQVLKFSGTLTRKTGNTDIQRFRVMVYRYKGEMDFQVDNSISNGWDPDNNQWAHVCRPGEIWSAKPYIKNQIQVLHDKEYVVNQTNKSGVVVKFSLPIRRKLTFEATSSGNQAVGAGNIVLAITSDRDYNLFNYRTYAFYKQL